MLEILALSLGMPHNVPPIGVPPPTTETGMPNLPMLRQPYGVGPSAPLQMQLPQPQHSADDMDVEMEDAMPQNSNGAKNKGNLTEQLILLESEERTEADQHVEVNIWNTFLNVEIYNISFVLTVTDLYSTYFAWISLLKLIQSDIYMNQSALYRII